MVTIHNTTLKNARSEKNDEFYTLSSDIEKELNNYIDLFKNKIIYCNCDGADSKFIKYFKNADIKKLLTSNTDFRNKENIELLKEADIIITNPPFSLFKEYIDILTKYNKKFLIVGNQNAISYKNIFKLIVENKVWLGNNYGDFYFSIPEKCIKLIKSYGKHKPNLVKVQGICWFTNLEYNKRNKDIPLIKDYNNTNYSKFDNYNAINIDKVKDIPYNYSGLMGVPLTFLHKWNPNQFELIDGLNTHSILNGPNINSIGKNGLTRVNGIAKYIRIVIKNKKYKDK